MQQQRTAEDCSSLSSYVLVAFSALFTMHLDQYFYLMLLFSLLSRPKERTQEIRNEIVLEACQRPTWSGWRGMTEVNNKRLYEYYI